MMQVNPGILVLGDSHAEVFGCRAFRRLYKGRCFHVFSVHGATISGIENPNSKTQALPIFEAALRSFKGRVVVVLLGEVDVGFTMHIKSQREGVCVSDIAKVVLKKYSEYLNMLNKNYDVVCVSLPLPTIRDGCDLGEVANFRKEVKASQSERTALTLWFNRKLSEFCDEKDICFIDLDDASLDENGVLREELYNRDPSDHHYDVAEYVKMLSNHIQKNVF